MRLTFILVCTWVAWAGTVAVEVRDIDNRALSLFRPLGKANVLFFISSDCPVSNSYAPEIQRLCGDYGTRGVGCSLVYEDVEVNASSVRKHLSEYRYAGIPAVIDSRRKVANQARATVTPEAVVIDDKGEIRYRGRIDNFYAALGQPRQQVTAHDLRDALDAVLLGRPVPNPETKALGCYIVPPDVLKK
jgi:thiol-disulfide isomerase/thioredoxin